MKILFTVCSNNYLAQAKTMINSFCEFNNDYKLVIGLIDKKETLINYEEFEPASIIPLEDLRIANLDDICSQYNIIELNSAFRASYFKFLFQTYPSTETIIYLDPDMFVYSSLFDLEREFDKHDILLTPHITISIAIDDLIPNEQIFLKYGLFNMGFLGLKKSKNTFDFLDWWEERLMKLCFMDIDKGFFVDQLIVNLVPILFENVKILKSLGYNVAPWNLQERSLVKSEDGWIMNDKSKLIFYHFSSYNPLNPIQMSKYNRSTFENSPTFKEIYEIYTTRLIKNGVENYKQYSCAYDKNNVSLKSKNKQNMLTFVIGFAKRIKHKLTLV